MAKNYQHNTNKQNHNKQQTTNKINETNMQQTTGNDNAQMSTRKTATKEHIRSNTTVDLIDIAKQLTEINCGRAELERLAATQTANVPCGKPLSVLDPTAFPTT